MCFKAVATFEGRSHSDTDKLHGLWVHAFEFTHDAVSIYHSGDKKLRHIFNEVYYIGYLAILFLNVCKHLLNNFFRLFIKKLFDLLNFHVAPRHVLDLYTYFGFPFNLHKYVVFHF